MGQLAHPLTWTTQSRSQIHSPALKCRDDYIQSFRCRCGSGWTSCKRIIVPSL